MLSSSSLRTTAVATAFLFGLAACSSDSDPAKSAASTTTAAATTTTSKPSVPTRSAGCSATKAATPGESKVDLQSGGEARWYLRHVPPTYAATTPSPVVVDLHGYQEGANVHTVMSGMGAYGDTQGFVTITPNGTATPVPRWNVAFDSADVKFIGDLLDDVEATLCVDPHRVFVAGLSNGAFMTSALACVYADRFAAAAPVAGVVANYKGCAPTRAVPLITFHGTADGFVAFDGGLGKDALNLPSPDGKGKIGDNASSLNGAKGPSIPEHVAAWAKRNGCDAKATETKVAADVAKVSYTCPDHADVVFYRVEGGGHAWPGSTFSQSIANVVGKTTTSINATELMWQFFRDHPLP